jgi:hypothetical protein
MIKHIVMWDVAKRSDTAIIKQKLEALKSHIPAIIDIEVGIGDADAHGVSTVVLYSTFASFNDLNAYQQHPEHQAVIPLMKSVTTARKAVDYEA